jgi:hypothetical protein
MQNDTTYRTEINDNFTNGMATYHEAMSEMGKFTGRLKDIPTDKFINDVFDFSFVEKVTR